MNFVISSFRCFLLVLTAMVCAGPLQAQSVRRELPVTPSLETGYRLEIRVLVRGSAAARVNDRNWAQLFQQAGYRVTIASDQGGETPGVRERARGRRAVVEVVGLIDRGVLHLGSQKFRLGEVQPLKDYLKGLQQYGADGPLRQRPTWGLSVDRYAEVLALLDAKAGQEVRLSTPADVIDALRLPQQFRVTWSPDARQAALSGPPDAGVMDLGQLSLGTGLAAALAQFGLGYRVMELPRGGFVLEVDAGNESDNLWPIGWKNKHPPIQVVPALYRAVAVDLEDEVVADVIDLVTDRVQIPWYRSGHQLAAKGIDLDSVLFSTPPAKTSPSRLLRSIANENRLGIEPRTDEAGQMFLWCTTAQEHDAWKKRFAHVVPGRPDTKPGRR